MSYYSMSLNEVNNASFSQNERKDDNKMLFVLYSYARGGPDVTRPLESRRSYGMESVEDDPFIVAASMQSMTSNDGKKKKQDPSVNYGYMSQGRT